MSDGIETPAEVAEASKRRLVVGISGASGFAYGMKALQLLKELGVESHLVMSDAANRTRAEETDYTAADVRALADVTYNIADIGAAIASGSFQVSGMLVAPCSMSTLASIANGIADNLLIRSADVTLKERRRLVLMVRESPLHLGHLRNMTAVTEMGGIVFPPVPAFYTKPKTLDDIITHSVGRALDLFGFSVKGLPRWGKGCP